MMKVKNGILICQLLILVILSITTNSCKKDNIKKDVVITWTNPADINFGILLSDTQLNATADEPGTFVYTPKLGTKLNIGENQDLGVVFRPTDAVNYNNASKIVQINVIVNHQFGTTTDQAGNTYKTITIGTQTWMAENLRTNKYRNLEAIDSSSFNDWTRTKGAFCVYSIVVSDNDAIYGKLYNWYAVNDSRNIAPTGWHVATDTDWTILITYLGGSSVAGGKMKETGTIHWNNPNVDATNESGFTALPGGSRNYGGDFFAIRSYGCWWSATNYGTDNAWYCYMSNNCGCIPRENDHKECGFSVRCVKN
jgi:uncharacterized protein (TIGR02145 family)